MREVQPGLYRVQGEEEVERFERDREHIEAAITKVTQEQRTRLTAGKPEYGKWWADVVFVMRDVKSIYEMLRLNGEQAMGDLLAEISTALALRLLTHVTGDEQKAGELLGELVREGDTLDAVISKEFARIDGEQVAQ